MRSGGCLCGGVRFEIHDKIRGVVYCHCSQCRRTHGHVAAYTSVPREALDLRASSTLSWFATEAASRGFCSRCGASLFFVGTSSDTYEVSAGTLDAPTGLRAVGHIFADSKSDYYEVADDLPRCADDDDDGVFSSVLL